MTGGRSTIRIGLCAIALCATLVGARAEEPPAPAIALPDSASIAPLPEISDPKVLPAALQLPLDESNDDGGGGRLLSRNVDEKDRSWPNIDSPGPDLGDYPNSAYTLPKGRAYLEMVPWSQTGTDSVNREPVYNWPFLFRYGLTDDCEFRFLGNGLTGVWGEGDPTWGWSPVTFDLKTHLWDERLEYFLPAVSLEVWVQTDWGSEAFNGGTQPGIALNLDVPLTDKLDIGATITYSGVLEVVDIHGHPVRRHHPRRRRPGEREVETIEPSFQWAIERDITDKLALFANGYINSPGVKFLGSGVVVGGGAFWQHSDRLIFFTACNAGVTSEAPRIAGSFGLAYALGPAGEGKSKLSDN